MYLIIQTINCIHFLDVLVVCFSFERFEKSGWLIFLVHCLHAPILFVSHNSEIVDLTFYIIMQGLVGRRGTSAYSYVLDVLVYTGS